MKKIELIKGNKKYSIIVNHIKFLCGPNYDLKYRLMNILRQSLTKIESSEYQIENNLEVKTLIDDSPIKKNTILFEVNQYFDLTTELKLQAKSLIGKYYETYLKENIHFDTISTINSLFELFSNQINDDENKLYVHFLEMNNKQLMKLLIPEIFIDDCYANMYDLNYEETIIFQLKLISYIVNKNPTQSYIVILDIPQMTERIQKHLEYSDNLITFVLLYQPIEITMIEDFGICYSTYTDMADEEYIYENIVERLPIYLNLREVYQLMELIICNEQNERTNYIIDLIK